MATSLTNPFRATRIEFEAGPLGAARMPTILVDTPGVDQTAHIQAMGALRGTFTRSMLELAFKGDDDREYRLFLPLKTLHSLMELAPSFEDDSDE